MVHIVSIDHKLSAHRFSGRKLIYSLMFATSGIPMCYFSLSILLFVSGYVCHGFSFLCIVFLFVMFD